MKYKVHIIVSILLFAACSNRQSSDNADLQEQDKQTKEILDRANGDHYVARNRFYRSCFSITRLRCNGQLPKLTLRFTNRTDHSIETVLLGLRVKDKLGNTIVKTDLQMTQSVPSQTSKEVLYDLPLADEANSYYKLCDYKLEQLDFEFSSPFAGVDETGQFGYRTTDVIVRFDDGTLIYDYKALRSFYRADDRVDDLRKQTRYLNIVE